MLGRTIIPPPIYGDDGLTPEQRATLERRGWRLYAATCVVCPALAWLVAFVARHT